MLFGITGKAGAGKSTLGDILVNNHGYIDVAFADTLKSAASIIFGVPIEHFYDIELKEVENTFWKMSPRQMLQKLGTDACRNGISQDVWIKSLDASLSTNFSASNAIVITDARFNNEADMIRNRGGKVIHIVTTRESQLDDSTKGHVSEAGIEFVEGDIKLWNDGSIADLAEEINYLLSKLGKQNA